MKQKQKTYVVDTSILITEPDIFFKLGKSRIIVPTAVIRELDGLKNNTVAVTAASARKVSRTLDKLGTTQNMASGARTSAGSLVQICNRYQTVNDLASIADNKIVGTALRMSEETGTSVVVLTTDQNMRNVARAHGLKAEPYPLLCGDIQSESTMQSGTDFSWNIISSVICAVLVLYFIIRMTS